MTLKQLRAGIVRMVKQIHDAQALKRIYQIVQRNFLKK